jgi:hypothetical protein
MMLLMPRIRVALKIQLLVISKNFHKILELLCLQQLA